LLKGIGVNIDTRRLSGSIQRFEGELDFFRNVGFDYIEIPPAGLDVIVRGRIIEHRMRRLERLISLFDFKYTVHAPDVVNLKHKTNPWHYKVFEAVIEFARRIKAEIIVYHCGVVKHSLDLTEREQKKHEVKQLRNLAQKAQEYGITIGVENTVHSMDEVLEVVEAVNMPNVGITLDIGHLFIVANYRGLDFFSQLKKGLKKAVEIHVSDNFAESPYTYQDIPDVDLFRFVYGIGDLHLPIGEGEIPYTKVFRMIRESGFKGIVTLEINSMDRFKEEYANSLNLLRRTLMKPPRKNGRNSGGSRRKKVESVK